MSETIKVSKGASRDTVSTYIIEDPKRSQRRWTVQVDELADGSIEALELSKGLKTIFVEVPDDDGRFYSPVQVYDEEGHRRRALSYADRPDYFTIAEDLGAKIEFLNGGDVDGSVTGDVLSWFVPGTKRELMAVIHVLQQHWVELREKSPQADPAARSKTIEIRAGTFLQHGQRYLYFAHSAADLLSFVEVEPNSEEHPNFPQRPVEVKRLRSIGDWVLGGGALLPSIIVNFYSSVDVKIDEDGTAIVRIPNDGKKHAYCLDGQHRLFAFDPTKSPHASEMDGKSFELAVTAMIHEPERSWVDQFIVINTTQKPVNKNQILGIKQYWGEADDDEAVAVQIAQGLNGSEDSVFYHKIFMRDGDKSTLIKLRNFVQLVRGNVDQNGALWDSRAGLPEISDLIVLFKNYTNAWHDIFKDEWGSSQHVLTKTAGWEAMLSPAGVLPIAFDRAKRNPRASEKDWKRILGPLRGLEVLLRGRDVPLTWESYIFRPYCSGRSNIDTFVKAVARAYRDSVLE